MRPSQPQSTGLLSRFIERYSPSVLFLVVVWMAAFEARRYLVSRDLVSEIGYRALTSLVYVVPIILIGWPLLAIANRFLGLGLFRSEE